MRNLSREQEKAFTEKIVERDNELIKRAARAQEGADYDTVYKIMQDRLSLYHEASRYVRSDSFYLFFTSTLSHINAQIAWYRTRQQMDEQIASLISRLDELENKVKTLQKERNDHNHS